MSAELLSNNTPATHFDIEQRIFVIRGLQVMIDSDLAEIYAVETRVFNQAVKRNIERFPPEFRFQLTQEEFDANLRSQIVISSSHGGRRYLPYAFTEQGVASFNPISPAIINPRLIRRTASAGSPNRNIPRTTVPTAPTPPQTA